MKDKLLRWKNGFPYDVVKTTNVTPNSSMADVRKASLSVMGSKFTPQLRQALEELRLVKRRLFVDFFLYQLKGEIVSSELLDKEIVASIQEIRESELTPFLTPDISELQEMSKDFKAIEPPEIHLEYLDWPDQEMPMWLDYIEFDS